MMKTRLDSHLYNWVSDDTILYTSGFRVHIPAAKCGHADVFDVFAKTGVSLKQPSSKIGMTALHIAAFFGEEEIARELFKHIPAYTKSTLPTKPENALIEDLCYECDLTALHLASYSGSENVVRAILNQPAVDVKSPCSPSGYTALHLACLTGHVGVVGLLLSRSTELLQVKDRSGMTSLHTAATHGHFEMCQVLECYVLLSMIFYLKSFHSLNNVNISGRFSSVRVLTARWKMTRNGSRCTVLQK